MYHPPRVEQNSSSSLYLVRHPDMVKGRQHWRLLRHHRFLAILPCKHCHWFYVLFWRDHQLLVTTWHLVVWKIVVCANVSIPNLLPSVLVTISFVSWILLDYPLSNLFMQFLDLFCSAFCICTKLCWNKGVSQVTYWVLTITRY